MSNLEKKIEDLNTQFCFVKMNGQTRVVKLHPELEFMTVRSFKEWMSNQTIWLKDAKGVEKPTPLGELWLKHPKRRQYEGVVLEPDLRKAPSDRLNLYRGWGVVPKLGQWPLMAWHITNILANGDPSSSGYIFRWIAWCLQNPDKCAQVVLVLRGDKGAGKGTLGKALCKIFGAHKAHIVDENLLTGRFKGYLLECLFLFADEAVWGGDKKGTGALQGMITEDITIEQKGLEAIPNWTNRLHIMMAADKDWAVPAGKHERRYAVFEVSNHFSHGNTSPDEIKAYFDALHKELYEAGGLEAMAYDLMNADLEGWHPRQVHATEALRKQQRLGMKPIEHWFEELLQEGRLPRIPMHQPPLAPTKATTAQLKAHASEFDFAVGALSKQVLAAFLESQGAIQWRTSGVRGWTFQSLKAHRDAWVRCWGPREWENPTMTEWQGNDGAWTPVVIDNPLSTHRK